MHPDDRKLQEWAENILNVPEDFHELDFDSEDDLEDADY